MAQKVNKSKLNDFLNFLRKMEDSPGSAAMNARKVADYFDLPTFDVDKAEASIKSMEAFSQFEEALDEIEARAHERGIELPETYNREHLLDKANAALGAWESESLKPKGTGSADTVRESTLEGGGKNAGFGVEDVASTTKTRSGQAAVRTRIENMLDQADGDTRAVLEQLLPDIRKRLTANLPKDIQEKALAHIENEGLVPYLTSVKEHIEKQVEKPKGYKGYLDSIKSVLTDLENVETASGNADEALKRFTKRAAATTTGPLALSTEIGQMAANTSQKVRDFGLAAVIGAVSGEQPGPSATTSTTPTEGPKVPFEGVDLVTDPSKTAKAPAPAAAKTPPEPGRGTKLMGWLKDNLIGDEKQRKAMAALVSGGTTKEDRASAIKAGRRSQSRVVGPRAEGEVEALVKTEAEALLRGRAWKNLKTAGTSPLALMLLSFAPQAVTSMVKGTIAPWVKSDTEKAIEDSGMTDPMTQYIQKRTRQNQLLSSLGQDPSVHADFHEEYAKSYGQQIAKMGDVPGRRYYGSAEPPLSAMDLMGLIKLQQGA